MSHTRPLDRADAGGNDPLAHLRSEVGEARARVQALRCGAVDREDLRSAHGALLEAMEAYAAELDRRRLPTPPALRDDLRLYRELRTRPGPPPPYRKRGPA